jgi:hypothetical protein
MASTALALNIVMSLLAVLGIVTGMLVASCLKPWPQGGSGRADWRGPSPLTI